MNTQVGELSFVLTVYHDHRPQSFCKLVTNFIVGIRQSIYIEFSCVSILSLDYLCVYVKMYNVQISGMINL